VVLTFSLGSVRDWRAAAVFALLKIVTLNLPVIAVTAALPHVLRRPSLLGLPIATAVCAILGFAAARYVGTRLAALAFGLHKMNVHDPARALQVRAIRRTQWAYAVLGGIVDATWPTLVIAIPPTVSGSGNPIGLIRGAPIVLLVVLTLIACGLMRRLGRAR
jgi:hypothetical protein